ncbi:hypothetical protein [Romboutsia sp. 1001713B170131_170501_G6]|nr:hypothetical protein [Romboutsia sp. 1001713B170131_170501_G6]
MIRVYQCILGKIYITVGHNWLTVKLSQLLDIAIVEQQRRELEKCLNK